MCRQHIPHTSHLTSPGQCFLRLQVPPFPTKAGARYALKRIFAAHQPGPLITMQDGTQQYGGVRCLTLCSKPPPANASSDDDDRNAVNTPSCRPATMGFAGPLILLSGGADGAVRRWLLQPPAHASTAEGLPVRGASLVCATCRGSGGCKCPEEQMVRVREPSLLVDGEVYPVIKGLDWHHSQRESSFVVGTSGCDLWAVTAPGPGGQRTVLDGHSAAVHMVAPHPVDADQFVTADESGTVLRYNVSSRLLEARTILGFKCYAIAVSSAHPHYTAQVLVMCCQHGCGCIGGNLQHQDKCCASCGPCAISSVLARLFACFVTRNAGLLSCSLHCSMLHTSSLPRQERAADEQYEHEQMLDSWRASSPRFSKCYHIAVSGKRGQVMILKWDNLQPLVRIPAKGSHEGVCDLRFTPAGAPVPMLAAASHDQHIYVYNVKKGYQCALQSAARWCTSAMASAVRSSAVYGTCANELTRSASID